MEDLTQSVEAIQIAYAQALLIDKKGLQQAQETNDTARAQEILQTAYRTDVRELVAEARLQQGGALKPISLFRDLDVRKNLTSKRGSGTTATGL